MLGDGILPGDIVLIRQQPTVKNGEIAAIVISMRTSDDLGVLKRYYVMLEKYKTLSHWLLESSNPSSNHLVVIPQGSDAKAIKDFYAKKTKTDDKFYRLEFYSDAEITIAGKYVGLVRKS